MIGQQRDRLLRAAASMLRKKSPPLEPGALEAYVETFFARADSFCACAEHTPPPFYLLDKRRLQRRACQFRTAFESTLAATSFYYAMKSNNHPEVAATLLDSGFGLDVSSGLELESALALGAEDIVFSGPGKTGAELALAVVHTGRVTVLIDSFNELHRLAEAAKQRSVQVRAGVRLTTCTDGLWRKFGIPLDSLREFWEEVARHEPHVRLCGIQSHTSWNLSPAAQIEVLEQLGAEIAGWPPRLRARIEFLDIGGGFWPPQGEWLCGQGTPEGQLCSLLRQQAAHPLEHYCLPADSINAFAEEIAHAFQRHIRRHTPCRVCFEPGRWICNDAMHLLLSVVDKKGEDIAITDGGTNMIGWERFESDYAPVLNLTRPALREVPCHVLGSLCTPHDVWGYSYWGEGLEPGDILLIPDQGAYTYSLRQQFIKPVPEVVCI